MFAGPTFSKPNGKVREGKIYQNRHQQSVVREGSGETFPQKMMRQGLFLQKMMRGGLVQKKNQKRDRWGGDFFRKKIDGVKTF